MMQAASRATRAWRRASPSRSEFFWPLRSPLLPPPPTRTVAVESLHVTVLATAGVGDGRRATEVPIGAATGVAVGPLGNIFIADPVHSRVRKVSSAGTVTTVFNAAEVQAGLVATSSPTSVAVDGRNGVVYVADFSGNRIWAIQNGVPAVFAGSGKQGYAGDGGAATAADLSLPADVAVGAGGTVYVADMGNHRIRAISSDGVIRTVAGDRPVNGPIDTTSGSLLYPSIVATADDGTLYVVDWRGRRILRMGRDGVLAAVPWIGRSYPIVGLAAGSGSDIVASAAGMLWQRSAGGWQRISITGQVQHSFSAVGMARDGSILAFDTRTHTLYRVGGGVKTLLAVAGNGTVALFGNGGPASGSSFSCYDIEAATDGRILFSDPLNHRIAVIDRKGIINTLADGPPASSSRALALATPLAIAMTRKGVLYATDRARNRVVRITRNGALRLVAGNGEPGFSGDGGPATDASLDGPLDVAVAKTGDVYIIDANNHRVRRIDRHGTIATVLNYDQSAVPLLANVRGDVVVIASGGRPFVTLGAEGESNIERDSDASSSGGPLPAAIDAMTVDRSGHVIIVSENSVIIQREARERGDFRGYRLPDPTYPNRSVRDVTGVTVTPDGDLLFCDAADRRILRARSPAIAK